MAVADVANGLVELCRQGKFLEAIERYYGPNVISVEPAGSEGMPAKLKGIENIKKKNEWFAENHDVHGVSVDGPYLGEEQFAVRYRMDITPKMTGKRTTLTEMALYTVKDDQVVMEEFYYNA